jgi:hypothetical protein
MIWPTWRATMRVRKWRRVTAWRREKRRQQARLRRAQWRQARGAEMGEHRTTVRVIAALARQAVWPAEVIGRLLAHVPWLRVALLGRTLEVDMFANGGQE